MDTVDKDLAKELLAAKKSPCNFAAVVGGDETVLIVAKSAIPPAKVKAAKDKTGGRVFNGRCFDENGVMVFEMESAPPGGLDKKIREAVKEAAKMSLRVEVRQVAKVEKVGENEAAEGEADESTGLAPKPSAEDGTEDTQAAAFKDRLKALMPGYQAAGKAAPDKKPALDQIVAQAMAAAKAKDYQQGLAHLERLETALTATQVAPTSTGDATIFRERLKALMPEYQAATKAAPAQKPTLDKIVAQAMAAAKGQNFIAGLAQLDQLEAAIKSAKQEDAAPDAKASAFKDRLKALMPEYQAAGKAAPEKKAALDKILAQTMAAAKTQDYAAGLAHLDQLEAALKATPGTDTPTDAAVFKERLKALTPDYQAAGKAAPDQKPLLDKLVALAMAAAKAQNYVMGLEHLKKLEAALKAAQEEEQDEDEDEASSTEGSRVAFTKARLAWDQARKAVRTELQKLEKAILAACASEPDFDKITANSGNLYEMLEILDESLIDTLDDLLNEENPARRRALRKEAAGIVAEYANYVSSDELLQEIDNNDFQAVKVYSTLQTTLTNLRSQLA